MSILQKLSEYTKNYVEVHIKRLVISRQVLDCRTQIFSISTTDKYSKPISTRGIFHREYFLSALWVSTFTRATSLDFSESIIDREMLSRVAWPSIILLSNQTHTIFRL